MTRRRILKKIFWKNTIISYFDFHYLYNHLLNVKQWKVRKIILLCISVFIYLSIYLLSIYLILFVYLFIFFFISCLFSLGYLLHLLRWDVFLSKYEDTNLHWMYTWSKYLMPDYWKVSKSYHLLHIIFHEKLTEKCELNINALFLLLFSETEIFWISATEAVPYRFFPRLAPLLNG